jgi:serine/threonine protein kinase
MLLAETILQSRYRIVRQLGQGGMGAVYEAVDQRLDTVVALKETLFTDEKLRKQFEREARLLARLHHQALPRVSDHFNEGDGQFLVMQYIPGEDLFEMQSRRNGPFEQEDVLRWADQLCDALDYLHTQDPQIIHRDIKPQNLKLSARGQIVLLDFGLAKGSAGQMSVVTTSASIFGYTPNYAPLEQVQGLGTDPRSDIYSLAATLYHLLTNVKPPDALSRAGAMVNGMPDPLVPADAVAPHVGRSVAAALETGMSQKRDDRFPTALAMREAFRLAAMQPAGEAATVLTSAGVSTNANTAASAPGTNIAPQQTAALGNEAQTLLANEATKVRDQTVARGTRAIVQAASAPRRPWAWLVAAALLVLIGGVAAAYFINRSRQSPATQTPTTLNPAATPAGPTQTPDPANNVQGVTVAPKNENPKPETGNQRAKQTGASPSSKATPRDDAAAREAEREAQRAIDRTRPPEPPPDDPMRNRQDRRPPPERPPVRTFPNGTRVEKRPDGTTIVTFPDGRTRVFPAGANPNRRRRIP